MILQRYIHLVLKNGHSFPFSRSGWCSNLWAKRCNRSVEFIAGRKVIDLDCGSKFIHFPGNLFGHITMCMLLVYSSGIYWKQRSLTFSYRDIHKLQIILPNSFLVLMQFTFEGMIYTTPWGYRKSIKYSWRVFGGSDRWPQDTLYSNWWKRYFSFWVLEQKLSVIFLVKFWHWLLRTWGSSGWADSMRKSRKVFRQLSFDLYRLRSCFTCKFGTKDYHRRINLTVILYYRIFHGKWSNMAGKYCGTIIGSQNSHKVSFRNSMSVKSGLYDDHPTAEI